MQAKIPATVITGFLGAGKTTMIRNLLENAGGRRIALIINEFGDLGVDGEVLKGCGVENCSQDDIVELNNGCICCTVADDFIPTMEKLLERDARPDHIVIETSGLALPQPLVAAFNWPGIKTSVTVDGVVTVIDAAAVAEGRFAADHDRLEAQRAADEALDHESPLEELFEDQIRAADLVRAQQDRSRRRDAAGSRPGRRGRTDRPGVEDRPRRAWRLPAEVLLGLNAATEDQIALRKSHHEMHHEAGDDHDHDHDEFESFVAEAGPVSDPAEFVDGLRRIIAGHDVLRLKGFCDVPGKPMRLVVQAVGGRIDTYYDRPWRPDEARSTRLVVIGLHDIDAAAIAQAVLACAPRADGGCCMTGGLQQHRLGQKHDCRGEDIVAEIDGDHRVGLLGEQAARCLQDAVAGHCQDEGEKLAMCGHDADEPGDKQADRRSATASLRPAWKRLPSRYHAAGPRPCRTDTAKTRTIP